jgi:AGZA family xanthine/uracil permease-like MFS transporter
MNKIEKFFKLKENGTTFSKEMIAGLTTFFAMMYIIIVNPAMLSETLMPHGAVFLATIFATVIGTLIMGLFANVPYALAPGMGLNAFFTYTVVFTLGFSWQEALALVFICGLINVVITVTKIRKAIIKAIPISLQHAIGGGIGLFIAYIGLKNAGMLTFTNDIPALTDFSNLTPVLALAGLLLTVVLLLAKVKGAILIGIIVTTLIGIPLKVTQISGFNLDIIGPFKEIKTTFFAAFDGMGTLFNGGISKILMSLLAIFAFSLTDTFDTIGTFIGTGRKSGIFNDEDLNSIENSKGFKTKMEKALFADSIATSIGALLGTSNTTTYVESAAGIEAGGRTGLTSVFTAILFLLCIFISPIAAIVPGAATAPALIIVGVMMVSSFKNILWDDLEEAIPAFFAAVLMVLAYNISTGIAFGFIFYIIVKLCTKKVKEIHPIIWGSAALFVVYYVIMALKGAGLF